jgi:DNA-directed RNA polymerase subunit RPC12/RpoP
MIKCAFCDKGDMVYKERYPKAMISILKEPYVQCDKCGYNITLAEYQRLKNQVKP